MRFHFWPLLALLAVADACQERTLAQSTLSNTPCAVTAANGIAASGQRLEPFIHGNSALSVILGWPEGTVTFKPGGRIRAEGRLTLDEVPVVPRRPRSTYHCRSQAGLDRATIESRHSFRVR
jgi:hypothetical protein